MSGMGQIKTENHVYAEEFPFEKEGTIFENKKLKEVFCRKPEKI